MKNFVFIVNTDGALYRFRLPILRALISRGDRVHAICGGGTYKSQLEVEGIKLNYVKFSRKGLNPLREVRLIVNIYQILKNINPDVVHCFTHKASIYGLLVSIHLKIPNKFVTVTGLGEVFSSESIRNYVLRKLILGLYRSVGSFSDKFFFQNDVDLNDFIGAKVVIDSQAVLTNGSGIDLLNLPIERFSSTFKLKSVSKVEEILGYNIGDKIVVLMLSRAIKEKGILEFYNASSSLKGRGLSRYVFIHLGDSDQGANGFSPEQLDSLANTSNVEYLAFQEDVSVFLGAADIVVLPSYYREGTPRSLIEALAYGKSIITTNTPGCRDTVVNGVNGFYCEVKDGGKSIVEILEKIDQSFIDEARFCSYELCKEKYDVIQLVKTTLNEYDNCIQL